MASYQKDYSLLSLSAESIECVVNEMNDLDEVSAKSLYIEILKAVKEVISDEKIDYLINLSQVLEEISKIKSDECLKNYQNIHGIGNFNLITLACKNKAIKVLEYIFSEKSQTLYNLSIQIPGYKKESLLSVKDEFCHNAFYYAMGSNVTDLLNFLVNKWQGQYSEEVLDDLLSQNYKELKLRNVSLTREMQLFVQSKILDLRFLHTSTAGNTETGNSWDQIKKRIEIVVSYIQSIKNDYWDQDPDDKFILIAEFIAKNIHVLKSLLKSTYDKLPWEEIEFCLIIFIRCCKNSSHSNMVYNCVLNKKQLLMHLLNFSDALHIQYHTFENNDVMKLAKSVRDSRGSVIKKIVKENSGFLKLYNDYEIIRDCYSLEIIKSYTDLIESSDATDERKHLLVSRILQVMGEHMKSTLDSPKLSALAADALLSSLSSNTREIVTKLRDSLSHEETLFVRSEIEKKSYLCKKVQKDILKIKAVIHDVLYRFKIGSVKLLIENLKLCKSIEDVKDCYGPYRNWLDLPLKEIINFNINTLIKGDFDRLEGLLLCLEKKIYDKTFYESLVFQKIYNLIRKEKQRNINLKSTFFEKSNFFSALIWYLKSKNDIQRVRRITTIFEDFPLESRKWKIDELGKLIEELLRSVSTRSNEEVSDIIYSIMLFMKLEMGSVNWIEEFGYIMRRNANKKKRNQKLNQHSSEKCFQRKLSQLENALIDFDLEDATSITDFESSVGNMELRAVMEMLVLDILCVLESSCPRNPFFLDSDYPLLTGKNLRNHLAHGNALIDVIFEESSIQLLANAKTILATLSQKNNKQMDKIIKCDCIKLKNSIEDDLRIISNQQKLFVSLGEGDITDFEDSLSYYGKDCNFSTCFHLLFDESGENIKDVKECMNEGADVYGRDYNSRTCLHFAAKAKDYAAVKWTLKHGLSTNSVDSSGQTVLHIAAKSNKIEVMRYLVEQEQMSLNVSDGNGKTPLHVAVENQNNEVVKYLSKFDICLTRKDIFGLTPLHTSIHRNNIDATKILLEKETNGKKIKSHNFCTFLHIAAETGNLNLVNMLIAKGIRIDSKIDSGGTPLHVAASEGHLEIVKTLVSKGADVIAKDEEGITPLQLAASIGSMEIVEFMLQRMHADDIDVSDYRNKTALIVATSNGHASVVELLLQKGASVNIKTNLGLTPLHFATFKGHYNIVELLLNKKAIIDCKSNKKETPLHLGAVGGHKEVVKLLLKEGADINATESRNYTPLHAAAFGRHKDIVDLLIHEGADIDCKNEKGRTALHLAALNADRGIVESLLKNGADIRTCDGYGITARYLLIYRGLSDLLTPELRDVNVTDDHGCTLLHVAASIGDHKLVEYCIENKCNINARTNSRLTALHLAARFNHAKTVRLLLKKGAEIDAEDDHGTTLLLFAVSGNCKEVVVVLLDHDAKYLESLSYDIITALKLSVSIGSCDIVEILLQNYKFCISNELEQELLNSAVDNNHKHILNTLLERGFKINGDAKLLHVAVNRRFYDMVELLLTKGDNPNILDKDKCTPLDIAVQLGDADMVQILLSEKTDIRIESKFIVSAAEFAVRIQQFDVFKQLLQMKAIDTNYKDIEDCTFLHAAAFSGSLDITRYLVAEGADINAKNKKNRKPVHIAAENGFKDIVEFYINCSELEDETAVLLLIAAGNGHANICELLLQRNPDVNKIHSSDLTPMHFALLNGHKDVLCVLLHYGAYYNADSTTLPKQFKGNEAASLLRKVEKLFTAVRNNTASEVERLLREESIPKYCLANAKCVRKETVLHYASWKGYDKIVKVLLKCNTNPNPRNKTGDTPLHYAVKFSHLSIVEALLSNGAIYNALSQIGKTPLDYATDRKIRDFLLFMRYIFKKVQDNDITVLKNLRGKNEDVMRAVVRAKNQEGKTLIEVAHICGFTKTEKLQMLFKTDLVLEVQSAYKSLREKKYNEAFLELESVIRKRIAIFGTDSLPVLDAKNFLATICKVQGNPDKALHVFREVHENIKVSLGEDHLKTLLHRISIAILLLQKGETEEALRIFEAIHIKLKEKLKPDDFNMIDFEYQYSVALFEIKKFGKALKINYGIQQKCGQKNEDEYRILLANSLFITAKILAEQERLLEAKELFEKAYEIRRNILTPHDSDTLTALYKIADVLSKLGIHDESLEKIEEVLEIQKSHLPADHIDILESEFNIGKFLYRAHFKLKALKTFLSLEPKIAVVAPDSDVMKANRERIATIKQELSDNGSEFVFDQIQKKIRESKGNHEK